MCRELLRGPLYYVLVLMFCALVFWRDSPVGILVLAMMSGGDGKICVHLNLALYSYRHFFKCDPFPRRLC